MPKTVRTFSGWLELQRGRPDAVGDLAGEARHDVDWPANAQHLDQFRSHLRTKGASMEALASLDSAWSEWQASAGGDS